MSVGEEPGRVDPLEVLRELDAYARELDKRSKQLAQAERQLEPVEQTYEAYLASFEGGLWEKHLAGDKFPPEAMRRRMAHQKMPVDMLGSYVGLMGERKRLTSRISTLKSVIDAKRSILSALKIEMEISR